MSTEKDYYDGAMAAEWPRGKEELAPVHWCARSEFGGYWSITRYDDIVHVEKDPELFSSEPNGPWHAFESHFSMQAEDGAPHHRSRKVVSRGFTPRVTRHLTERVRRYADEAIDELVDGCGD